MKNELPFMSTVYACAIFCLMCCIGGCIADERRYTFDLSSRRIEISARSDRGENKVMLDDTWLSVLSIPKYQMKDVYCIKAVARRVDIWNYRSSGLVGKSLIMLSITDSVQYGVYKPGDTIVLEGRPDMSLQWLHVNDWVLLVFDKATHNFVDIKPLEDLKFTSFQFIGLYGPTEDADNSEEIDVSPE